MPEEVGRNVCGTVGVAEAVVVPGVNSAGAERDDGRGEPVSEAQEQVRRPELGHDQVELFLGVQQTAHSRVREDELVVGDLNK